MLEEPYRVSFIGHRQVERFWIVEKQVDTHMLFLYYKDFSLSILLRIFVRYFFEKIRASLIATP